MSEKLLAELEWEGLDRGKDQDTPGVLITFSFGDYVSAEPGNGWHFQDKTIVSVKKSKGCEDLTDLTPEEISKAHAWFDTRSGRSEADNAALAVRKDWLEINAPQYDAGEHRFGRW